MRTLKNLKADIPIWAIVMAAIFGILIVVLGLVLYGKFGGLSQTVLKLYAGY